MTKTTQNVITVNGRKVKFFATRKEAREYNRKNGTVGFQGSRSYWRSYFPRANAYGNKCWFVFLDTRRIIPSVAGQPVKFFATRQDARSYYWNNKGFPARYFNIENLVVPYEGNENNYRWFVYI